MNTFPETPDEVLERLHPNMRATFIYAPFKALTPALVECVFMSTPQDRIRVQALLSEVVRNLLNVQQRAAGD